MFTRFRLWQRRNSSLVTGLLMTFLWTCLALASSAVLVKIGLFPVAAWKLLDTLNAHSAKRAEEKMPHIGGGLTTSASQATHKEEVVV